MLVPVTVGLPKQRREYRIVEIVSSHHVADNQQVMF
jgi:hypothetical protein